MIATCGRCARGVNLHYDKDHHAETRAATRRADLAAMGQMVLDA